VDLSDLSTSTQKIYNQLYKHKSSLFFSLFIIAGLGIVLFLTSKTTSNNIQASLGAAQKAELGAFSIQIPTLKYGFALDTFQVYESEIKPGEFLSDLLQAHKVDYLTIEQVAKSAKEIFDVRRLRAGKPYTILSKDTTQAADYLVYEPNAFEYVVFDLKNGKNVRVEKREVAVEQKSAAGQIESSLWNAMVDNGMSYELTAEMENALQWSIDFHHVQQGDQFKLVYDQKFVDGEVVGVGRVHAAYYKTGENEYHAIYYDKEGFEGYYDIEGRPMEKGFLKAPVKFSRISSRYNPNRFHPILKRVRPHYGTDYAAPYGTPIYAVGNGVVSRAGYTKGNGNFVKIKHDDTYSTQYLHMQKFASGMSVGKQVKQGQVIGYVGSTGLATGPHVCFRFWKNGRQVDHTRLEFPPADPLPAEELPAFEQVRDDYLAQFEKLTFKTISEAKEIEEKEILEEPISESL